MDILCVKGRRREVRGLLAGQSKVLLDVYRAGREVDASACLYQQSLSWRRYSTAQVSA